MLKQKQNRTEQNRNPQETSQVNKGRKLKRKIQSRRVGKEGWCQRSSAFIHPAKTLRGELTLKVHRLGKSFHRGHKIQNKNSSSITLPQSPKKKVGPTAPCD